MARKADSVIDVAMDEKKKKYFSDFNDLIIPTNITVITKFLCLYKETTFL